MTRPEQLYNESHVRTRNSVERQIGVWKRRFPILAYGLRYQIEQSCNIIVATAVLHNLAIDNKEGNPPLPDDISEEELDYLILQGNVDYVPVEEVHNRDIFSFRRNLINNYSGRL